MLKLKWSARYQTVPIKTSLGKTDLTFRLPKDMMNNFLFIMHLSI